MLNVMDRDLLVSEAVVSAELDDEAVLLNVETGVYFGLDAVGTRIWQLVKQGRNETEIVSILFEEYDVDVAQLRADVSRFLAALWEKGLISRAG